MDWWIWILLGLALLLIELVTPGGFYILFFGIGAVIVGILVALESAGPLDDFLGDERDQTAGQRRRRKIISTIAA